MRLRSTQFVFLLLLVCSTQMQADYAARLLASTISGTSASSSQHREAAAAPPESIDRLALRTPRPAETSSLNAASHAAESVAWTVRAPARHTSSVISYTGLLRA